MQALTISQERRTGPAGPRRIVLCADDYGIAAGVDRVIRELAAAGRLNATSVMVLAPQFDRAAADALAALNVERRRVAIGLHFTLTVPFAPLSDGYRPLADGQFLTIAASLRNGLLRRFDPAALAAEARAQLQAFIAAFGRPPDFVDGHQHVHLFPQVRDAVLAAMRDMAPGAWVRQCGGPRGAAAWPRQALVDRKGLLIDALSRAFRSRAAAYGIACNPAFAGTYDYRPQADFAALFPGFLDRMPDGGVVMCHPGLVDDELRRLDPLTTLREREYAFMASEAFPRLLATHGVTLA